MTELGDLKIYLDSMFAERDKALALQHIEYLRRMENLNGESARIKDIISSTVSRERWDTYMEEHDRWGQEQLNSIQKFESEVREKFAEERGARAAERQADQKIVMYVGIALTLLELILKFVPIGFGLTQ